ncbi:MAG: DUF3782 domain-containing protein [Candidatus Bathyarchaeia archaeon]
MSSAYKQTLKKRIIKLLREDEEFKHIVAGFIGLGEILERLDNNQKELVKFREDMNKGFARHDEILNKHTEILTKHSEELVKLREDMMEGFKLIERHISALGARWGIMAENAFREGLKGLLEKEFNLKISKWTTFDDEGLVFGYPSVIDVDIAIMDEKLILIEVKSNIDVSDVYAFKRKAELYKKKTGKKPTKLLIVTPYSDEKALEAATKLEIEIYTKI